MNPFGRVTRMSDARTACDNEFVRCQNEWPFRRWRNYIESFGRVPCSFRMLHASMEWLASVCVCVMFRAPIANTDWINFIATSHRCSYITKLNAKPQREWRVTKNKKKENKKREKETDYGRENRVIQIELQIALKIFIFHIIQFRIIYRFFFSNKLFRLLLSHSAFLACIHNRSFFFYFSICVACAYSICSQREDHIYWRHQHHTTISHICEHILDSKHLSNIHHFFLTLSAPMSQASPRFVDNYNEEDRITPAFLTLGQKYSIAIGSTVVLPCKINETGTFYIRIHVINFRFKFFRPSQQHRIDSDLYETGQLAFLFDFDRRCCCCTRRVKFDENVRFVDLNMSTYCVAIDTGYACLSLHSVPFFLFLSLGL